MRESLKRVFGDWRRKQRASVCVMEIASSLVYLSQEDSSFSISFHVFIFNSNLFFTNSFFLIKIFTKFKTHILSLLKSHVTV